MNDIQKLAHAEGFMLVANAFKTGNKFNVEQAVAWVNRCISNDPSVESLSLVDRHPNADISQVRKFEAPTVEMCGYRLTGIFSALEAVRANLQRGGVKVNFISPMPALSADTD